MSNNSKSNTFMHEFVKDVRFYFRKRMLFQYFLVKYPKTTPIIIFGSAISLIYFGAIVPFKKFDKNNENFNRVLYDYENPNIKSSAIKSENNNVLVYNLNKKEN